jgi:pSer/pThr/pTyr-binding forkhead associated (FHA) protein
MAKFTVFFKDKAIHSAIFDNGIVHIGRDDTNELVVDSLAVAPAHAVAILKDGSCVVKQMNEKFPLMVNNQSTKEWNLNNNDVINVGKHYILYNTSESFIRPSNSPGYAPTKSDEDLNSLNEKLEEKVRVVDAHLQIMDGPHIGRILPLKKPLTRLGHEGGSVAVIARRRDGYYVSALQSHDGLLLNRHSLEESTVLLRNGDVLQIDKTPMQFFMDPING